LIILSDDIKSTKVTSIIDEDGIFKSLSHKVRRDIIRLIGNEKEIHLLESSNKLVQLIVQHYPIM